MATIPHEPSEVVQETQSWSARLLVPEMWASLAIVVMRLARAVVDAVHGPDIVSTNGAGPGTSTTVPSAVVVALFGWAVAKSRFQLAQSKE